MRRSISVFLILALVLSMFSFTAFASGSLDLCSASGDKVDADQGFRIKWNDVGEKYTVTVYDDTIDETVIKNKATSKTSYSISSSKLAYARTYVITVKAYNDSGWKIGSESITVRTYAGPGSCTTGKASLKNGQVRFKFTVDTNGGSGITDCGIVYGTSKKNLDQQISYGELGAQKGTYTVQASLASGTYYYRAYVTNAYGTAYGSRKSVKVEGSSDSGSSSAAHNPQTTSSSGTKKLDVVSYVQYDSRWADEYVNPNASTRKTIGKIGCALTAVSMVYSYKTGTDTTPVELRDKWRFDGNSIYWTGFNVSRQSGTITQSALRTIYDEINKGNPVIIGGYPSGNRDGTWHYIVVTGYRNCDPNDLKTSDFLINDPGNSSRTTLADFFSYKACVGQIITVGNTSQWP